MLSKLRKLSLGILSQDTHICLLANCSARAVALRKLSRKDASLQFSSQAGITLVEMLVVLAIVAILFVMVYEVFVNYNRGQALEKSAAAVTAVLSEARSKTLAGRGAAQYGVHFASDSVTFFTGATYNSSDPNNKTEHTNSLAEISSISLNGGGSNAIFEKLTGATSQYGTIIVRNKNNPAQTMTVTIYQTGLVEIK